MPVDPLSAAQAAGYGRYGQEPTARQLERFFHFDERDRELIGARRGDGWPRAATPACARSSAMPGRARHNRLGFAVQLATVRFLGTFLAHPAEVPALVIRRVAEEIAVTDTGALARYARRVQTHREHASEIRRA